MQKDIVFRGCTRPAMFMGIPLMPFFVATFTCLVLAMYVNLFCLIALPVVLFVLRQVARQDEMIFRLWWLRFLFQKRAKNKNVYQNMSSFSPNSYRDDLHEPRS